MAKKLTPKRIQELDIYLEQDHKIVINRIFSLLSKSLISQGKYSNLWGVKNSHLTYELYFTERSIEALSELLLFYKEDEIKIKPTDIIDKSDFDFKPIESKTKIKSKNKTILKESLSEDNQFDDQLSSPFKNDNDIKSEKTYINKKVKDLVSKIAPPNLPILEECYRQVSSEMGSSVFSNTNILFALHFLKDLIPFIEIFQGLGCEPQNMYFLVKNYNYPHKDLIKSYFKESGSEVFSLDTFDENKFSALTKKILTSCSDNAQRNKKKILIIEDGGYFVPLFHQIEFKPLSKICIGAVEQTSKGHWRDQEIKKLSFPVISVAKSRVKTILEGKEVSETLQENIVFISKNYIKSPNEKINVLILGYGTIGKGLARALAHKNFRVYVYDKDPIQQLDASLEIYLQVLENLDNIGHIDLIVGVSGSTSLQNSKHFWHLKHNVYLLSGSSERVEFDLQLLDNLSESKKQEGIITEYKLKKDKKIINLICEGEPINFELSGGINDAVIDPVYSEMFLSSTEFTKKTGLKNELQDVPILIEQKVLDIYKEYYRKPK